MLAIIISWYATWLSVKHVGHEGCVVVCDDDAGTLEALSLVSEQVAALVVGVVSYDNAGRDGALNGVTRRVE